MATAGEESGRGPVGGSVVFVKLGGSVLTDKRQPGTVRASVLSRLAAEIRSGMDGRLRIVLGHGSGSFGHVAASRYDLVTGIHSPSQLRGVAETQNQARLLHAKLVSALLEVEANPYSLAPSSFVTTSLGKPVSCTLEPLRLALEVGVLPVVYGDVVMDRSMGVSICSTETVFRLLIEGLRQEDVLVERVLWVGETEGILDTEGAVIPEINRGNYDEVLASAGGASGVDVTGGMRHRLETVWNLAALGVESWILNGLQEGRLAAALRGEVVKGTRVPGLC